MDDTRMDLSQLEDTSTGRSVPSTPLQVSPQGANIFYLTLFLSSYGQNIKHNKLRAKEKFKLCFVLCSVIKEPDLYSQLGI